MKRDEFRESGRIEAVTALYRVPAKTRGTMWNVGRRACWILWDNEYEQVMLTDRFPGDKIVRQVFDDDIPRWAKKKLKRMRSESNRYREVMENVANLTKERQ